MGKAIFTIIFLIISLIIIDEVKSFIKENKPVEEQLDSIDMTIDEATYDFIATSTEAVQY